MKKHRRPALPIFAAFLSAAVVSACVPAQNLGLPGSQKAGTKTETVARGPVGECRDKPKASIAVSRFDNKARNWKAYSTEIGDGMADQLTTALVSTGCFKVVKRHTSEGVEEKLELRHSEDVDPRTASRIGRIVEADLIVTAAVVEFTENASGSRSNVETRVGSGLLKEVLSSLGSAAQSAHIAANLRITDVQTSEIVAATAVEGTVRDVNQTTMLGALFPSADGLGALESWEKTPRGAALRQVIEEAVAAIHEMIPPGYFRHSVGRFGAPPRDMESRTDSPSGSNGVVLKAQRTLKALGLYDGAVDGVIGPRTERAIQEFQEQAGLDPTGKLDVRTMKELDKMTR